jgi:hypothetical protein
MTYATRKIPRIASAAFFSASLSASAAVPALAQSGNGYGLNGLKSYDASVATPANGLARVIRSENQHPTGARPKFQPDISPAVTIHAYGAVVVDSTIRR